MIKVNIQASRRIFYDLEVEITPTQYEITKNLEDEDVNENSQNADAYKVLDSIIDLTNIFYSENEFTDVTVNNEYDN